LKKILYRRLAEILIYKGEIYMNKTAWIFRDLFHGNITYKEIYGLILFFGKQKKMQIMQQQLGKVKKQLIIFMLV